MCIHAPSYNTNIKSILIPVFELLKCFACLSHKQCTVQTRASGISSNLRSAGLPNWTGSTLFKGTNNKRGRPSISLSWIAVFVLVLCTFAIQCLRSFMFVLFASFALRVVLKSFYVLIFLQWAEVKARANLAQLVAVPVQHKLSLHIACIPSSFLPVQDKVASLYRP